MAEPHKRQQKFSDFLILLASHYPEVPYSTLLKIFNEELLLSYVGFLNFFNVLETQNTNNEINYIIKGENAKNFILSLASYFAEDLKLISNWEGMGGDAKHESIMNWGINFLRDMEIRRVQDQGSPVLLREVENISLVIKANLEGVDQPVYLFRFDAESLSFKAIGGKIEKQETIKTQIDRFMKKELGLNKLNYPNDYSFETCFDPVETAKISQKTGLYTKHKIHYYCVKFKIEELKLSSLDRWLTMKELKNSKTNDDIEILSYFKHVLTKEDFVRKLEEMPSSFAKPQDPKNFIHVKQKTLQQAKGSGLSSYLEIEESENLEFKSSIRWDYKQGDVNKALEKVISKTVVGFLNTNGGTLIIGIDDNKQVLGIEKDIETLQKKNTDGFMQYLVSLVATSMGIEFTNFVKITFEKVEDKSICILEVKKSMQPVFYKDGENREFYVRAGNTTRQLNIEEIYKYIELNW